MLGGPTRLLDYRAWKAADMDELPQYFWLHITSTVILAVLALAATAALLRWTLDEVEDR
jgi:hypothetical protein